MIPENEFQSNIEKMLRLAATRIPRDVTEKLERAYDKEENQTARNQLEAMIKNLEVSKTENVPICQDTGLPVFFIKGNFCELEFDIKRTIENGVVNATKSIPLRPNVVDPLSRKNSDNNTGKGHPLIYINPRNEKKLTIELMLKGGGSENWSRLFMLNPTASRDEIKNRILNLIEKAEGQICPPSIVGVGIGGTSDKASFLSKKALLRPLNEKNKDPELRKLEEEITTLANDLDIGPMGLSGKTTTLGTRIEKAGSHTASLPVAVSFQCWAARRAKAILSNGKLKIEVPT